MNVQVDNVVLDRTATFARQLRAGTADLHTAVEQMADLPASVQTIDDYGRLLSTFHEAHVQIEAALGADELAAGWLELGIDIASHSQLDRLTEDLTALGIRPGLATATKLHLSGLGEALGCLYVMEGSALGRRVLAPLLSETLGDVPIAFFHGRGGQSLAWRVVQGALQSSTGDVLRQQATLNGARLGFGIFLDAFRLRAALRRAGCG